MWFATFILMIKPSLQVLLTFRGGGHMRIEAILRIVIHICTVIINIVNVLIIVVEATKNNPPVR